VTASRRRFLAAAAGAVLLLTLMAPGASGRPATHLLYTPVTRQLTHVAPYWHAGEPWGAVNPKDPDNVVIFDTELYNETSPGGTPQVDTEPRSSDHLFTFRCGVSVTFDGGRTWRFRDFDHPGAIGGRYDCIDPSVTADKDGAMHVIYFVGIGEPQADTGDVRGEAQVRTSRDGGRTWGPPSAALGQLEFAQTFPQGHLYPTPLCPPTDRVWLTSDFTNGVLYATGNGDGAAPCDEAVAVSNEGQGRYVVASHDHGRSWSAPYPIGQGMHAAAFGTLVITTTADGSAYTFKLSRDDGRTFIRRPVPVVAGSVSVNPLAPGLSQLDAPKTAADPTRRGHYAVLVATHQTSQFDVLLTTDSGKTWARTAVLKGATGTVTEPALAYGPTGDLGAAWRLVHPDGSYDSLATVSLDGGRTFTRAVRLTSTASPASAASLGDDCQCFVYPDGATLWTAWGDNRTDNREVFYSKVYYRASRRAGPAAGPRDHESAKTAFPRPDAGGQASASKAFDPITLPEVE
jgi:hypothetical protein